MVHVWISEALINPKILDINTFFRIFNRRIFLKLSLISRP